MSFYGLRKKTPDVFSSRDYDAFVFCMAETRERIPIQIFSYCIMPNHFHLVVRPEQDGQLAEFMRLMTGTGAVYQGRYKAFAVQTDSYFLNVCRYVERNALRANLVKRAEHWRWSSVSRDRRNCTLLPLNTWPILQPLEWIEMVNAAPDAQELADLRRSVTRNRPYGPEEWRATLAQRLQLEPTLHARGRPSGAVGFKTHPQSNQPPD